RARAWEKARTRAGALAVTGSRSSRDHREPAFGADPDTARRAQQCMRARLACLAHLAVRIEADSAVAEGRGPDTAARCGGDVDDPARGEARSAVERDEC